MSRKDRNREERANVDELIEEIIVDAYGEDEQLSAFRQVLEDEIGLPVDGLVIGEPVSVLEIDYDGNEHRGLTAICRREDGDEYEVAACDVVFPQESKAARYLAAYRRWLGLEPYPASRRAALSRGRQHKAPAEEIDLSRSVSLVVLAVKERAAPCRLLGSNHVVTLRAARHWSLVPGEIVRIKPAKQWRYGGTRYLSGEIESVRFDAVELGLTPLTVEKAGMWDPVEQFVGESDELVESWMRRIIAGGPRPAFVMEQVLPLLDPEESDWDPIGKSIDLSDAGDRKGAEEILMEVCRTDLRCLDAHAHLGYLSWDLRPEDAIRYYKVGLSIGELSFGEDFDGVLPWGHTDNRPFLRCMQGYGLCLWRLERFEEAADVFQRLLWLNPNDNQGVRFVIDSLRTGRTWEPDELR